MLFGGTVIGVVSLTLSIIGRLYPSNPAKAMARLTLSYGAAQIVGPIAAAYALQGGDYRRALLLATAVGVVGTIFSLALCAPRAGGLDLMIKPAGVAK